MTEHIRHIQRGGEVDFNPDPKNRFVRSKLREFHHHAHHSGLSVKTVIQGEERYRVGGKWHVLRPGYFLLVNHGQEIECEFREPEPVEGLCLYLDDRMVHDILHTMCTSEEHLLLNRLNTGTATRGFW
ncbi:MAG: AraC family ligand binding domain-containing protein, partial [Bacteroidota bacterium]